MLPAFARSDWLPIALLDHGPFGIELLKPLALFGLTGLDQITHAMIWSMIANVGVYVVVSLSRLADGRRASPGERVRRRVPARGRRRAVLARDGVGAGSAQRARALSRRGCRRHGVRRVRARPRPALARRQSACRRGVRALRRDAARRGDRRGFRARHGGLRGQGGRADARRGARDSRRGVAGRRLQPQARAEVARARGRDGRAPRGQRAPEGARPAQGRLHLDGDARAAHAAHLDPRVLRDPARRSEGRARPSAGDSSASSPGRPNA